MKARTSIPSINQGLLMENMVTFLAYLNERPPRELKKGGICGGLTFMMMRADLIDDLPTYVERIFFLAEANDRLLYKMARLLTNYRAHFQKSVNALDEKIKLYKSPEKIKEIRQLHHETINKNATQYLNAKEQELLTAANDLYFFINALLFSQNPDLRIKGIPCMQKDFIDLLKLMPPDKWIPFVTGEKVETKEEKSVPIFPVRCALKVDFLFTKKEAITALEMSVREGDHIRINTETHAMRLKKVCFGYHFYDPNGTLNTYASLQTFIYPILRTYYKKIPIKGHPNYFPFGFHIYETKPNPDRPTTSKVISDILKSRGKNLAINIQGRSDKSAIAFAVRSNNEKIMRILRNKNAYLRDGEGNSIASIAAVSGKIHLLNQLPKIHLFHIWKKKGEEYGYTTAHFAAMNNHAHIIDFLATQGVNIDKATKIGVTPIMLAVENGHEEAILELARLGVDLNKLINTGLTLATQAVKWNNKNALQILARAKADLNKPTKQGETPAFIAADNNSVVILRELDAIDTAALTSESKACQPIDFCKKNRKGETPFSCAAKKGHTDVIKFFITDRPHDTVRCLLEEKDLKKFTSPVRELLTRYRKKISDDFIQYARGVAEKAERNEMIRHIVYQKNALGKLYSEPEPSFSFSSLRDSFFSLFCENRVSDAKAGITMREKIFKP